MRRACLLSLRCRWSHLCSDRSCWMPKLWGEKYVEGRRSQIRNLLNSNEIYVTDTGECTIRWSWSYLFELLDLGLIEHGKDVRSGPLATLLWVFLSRCSRSALSEKKQDVNDKNKAVLSLIDKLARNSPFSFLRPRVELTTVLWNQHWRLPLRRTHNIHSRHSLVDRTGSGHGTAHGHHMRIAINIIAHLRQTSKCALIRNRDRFPLWYLRIVYAHTCTYIRRSHNISCWHAPF